MSLNVMQTGLVRSRHATTYAARNAMQVDLDRHRQTRSGVGVRVALVEQIQAAIAAGGYDTPDKMDAIADAVLDDVLPSSEKAEIRTDAENYIDSVVRYPFDHAYHGHKD